MHNTNKANRKCPRVKLSFIWGEKKIVYVAWIIIYRCYRYVYHVVWKQKNSDQYVCTFKQRLTNDQSLSQGNRDWPVTSLSTRETDWPLIETDQWSVSRPEKQRLTTDQSFGQRNKDWPLISLSARETETDRWPVTRPEKLRSLSLTKVSSFSPPPPRYPR